MLAHEVTMGHARAWTVPAWLLLAAAAYAADIPVAATKLLLIQKFGQFVERDSVVYVAKDPGVTKGTGTDPEAISVSFHVEYGKYYGKGVWPVAAGTANGWLSNDPVSAKYKFPGDPTTMGAVNRLVIKQEKLLKIAARRFGAAEQGINPAETGDPFGPVYTAYCVTNGVEENCHCTEFPSCAWQSVSGGLGAKLVCKPGVGDASCRASCSDVVDQGLTAADACTGLEWEKKDTVAGSGPDAANLHDVDNRYSWAGRCTLDTAAFCQPDAAAAATCAAQAGTVNGCAECGVGQGTCDVDPFAQGVITTVWDWLNQVNAASFAGHSDWRLPTGSSPFALGTPADPPSELASLADHPCAPGEWCIHSAVGSAASAPYWTSAGYLDALALSVEFQSTGAVSLGDILGTGIKTGGGAVRAVR